MRVITGKARGKQLKTLSGNDVRPTTDMVKEAVFSMIQFDIEGRTFLDLFSGSGQMGIEAISRGAKKAYFIDNSRKSAQVIKDNISSTNFEDNAEVFIGDSKSFLMSTYEEFDFAFLDPPYATGVLQENLPLVAKRMKKTGVIICESPQNEELPTNILDFVLDRKHRYGKIKISTYCHKDMTD